MKCLKLDYLDEDYEGENIETNIMYGKTIIAHKKLWFHLFLFQ